MTTAFRSRFLAVLLLAGLVLPLRATDAPSEAQLKRADAIVAALHLPDSAQAARVSTLVAGQYRDLGTLQFERDAKIQAAKEYAGATKPAIDAEVTAARAATDAKVAELHRDFLARLAAELAPAQIEQVKDGMTYGVLPLTFRVYQEMLPNLTAEQKAQIHAWLVEAREHAMDGFTSEEKHAWFGKYKGRINNDLAAAGYDMKQAEKDMLARQKTPAAKK
jgi:hypothetical protein